MGWETPPPNSLWITARYVTTVEEFVLCARQLEVRADTASRFKRRSAMQAGLQHHGQFSPTDCYPSLCVSLGGACAELWCSFDNCQEKRCSFVHGFTSTFGSTLAMHCNFFLAENPSGDKVLVTGWSVIWDYRWRRTRAWRHSCIMKAVLPPDAPIWLDCGCCGVWWIVDFWIWARPPFPGFWVLGFLDLGIVSFVNSGFIDLGIYRFMNFWTD